MLRGDRVGLRARHEADVSVPRAELYDDVATGSRADSRPRRPVFAVRGPHRLRIETLADNSAMIQAAERAGFAREGVLRGSAWVTGAFVDEVALGRLAADADRA